MRGSRLAIALAALAALWLAMLLLGAGPGDQAVLDLFYAEDARLAQAARLLTELGGSAVLVPAVFAIAFAAGFLRRDWRAPAIFVVLAFTGRVFIELQKGWTMRLRPDAHEQLAPIASYAFPSGHSANAMIVWLGAAVLLSWGRGRRWAIVAALLVAVTVGVTRLMLGVHWPSDVVAGWSLGLFWTLLLVRFCGRAATDCSPASA